MMVNHFLTGTLLWMAVCNPAQLVAEQPNMQAEQQIQEQVQEVAYTDVTWTEGIHYPQITQYRGELIKGYLNQSLKKPAADLQRLESAQKKALAYEVIRADGEYISVLYTQTLTDANGKVTKTKIPVTMQTSTAIELTMETAFADPAAVVAQLQDARATVENVRFYLEADGAVTFLFRTDDMQEDVVKTIDAKTMQPYWNANFGERPAS